MSFHKSYLFSIPFESRIHITIVLIYLITKYFKYIENDRRHFLPTTPIFWMQKLSSVKCRNFKYTFYIRIHSSHHQIKIDISSTHEGSLVSRPSSPFPHKRNHLFDIYYQKSILPVTKFHINWIIRHTLLYLFSLNIYYVSEIFPHYLCILFIFIAV